MSVCALCGKTTPGEKNQCPRCTYPDHLIEAKYNKHDGKAPTKRGAGNPNAPYRWPKFKAGTKRPVPPDGDRVG